MIRLVIAYGVDVVGNFAYVADSNSGLQILETGLQLSGVPSKLDIGNYELELVAEDPDHNQASSTFIVRVEGPPVREGSIPNLLANVGVLLATSSTKAFFPIPTATSFFR